MNVPIIVLYILSFLASRIMVSAGFDRQLIFRVLRRVDSTKALLFRIMGCTALLSMCIPNTVATLVILPLVITISQTAVESRSDQQHLQALLGLGVIYGANIGGMASLIGSPANGLFLLALEAQGITTNKFTILSWFAFGFPMALLLLGLAGLVLWRTQRGHILQTVCPVHETEAADNYRAPWASGILALSVVGPILASLLHGDTATLVSLFILGLVLVVSFRIRLPFHEQPLLRISDLYEGLPWRGLAYIIAAVSIGAALEFSGMLDPLVQQVGSMAPTHDYRILLWVLVMATIFCTELLSNSVTAMAFWVLAIGVASHQGFEPTGLMLGIGLASTCAFMSPISTPATALAYGGFKAISLPTMLRLGFIVNIIAATIITLCSIYWIPWVLSSS